LEGNRFGGQNWQAERLPYNAEARESASLLTKAASTATLD
jgi:hypothetical protein